MTPTERVAYDNDFSRALDEIIRGQSARSHCQGRPRPPFQFDAAARQELEGLIEARAATRRSAGDSATGAIARPR